MSQKHGVKIEKKFIKNARNVLALPKEAFWPALQEPESSSLLELLKNDLKEVRTIQPQIPWNKKQKVSKEERKNMIAEFYKNLPKDSFILHQKALNLKKDLTLGINEVSRGVENSEIACCLISGNTNPKLLVSHIADLCKAKRIPVLIVNSLKENIKDSLGFSALAIGLKNEIQENPTHEMHRLCNEIINLFYKNYTYNTQSSAENNELCEDEDKLCSNLKYFIFDKKESPVISTSEINLDDIYLCRTSKTYRVFKPNELSNSPSKQIESNLSVNRTFEMNVCYSEDEDKIVTKKGRYYEPPKVLRIQNNTQKRHRHKKKKK